MSRYLAALKGRDFTPRASEPLQKVQEGASCSSCSTQVTTQQELRGAASPRNATPAEAAELARLIARILPDDPEGQAEALAIACADPEAALLSLRALATDLPPPPPDPLPALPTCEDCRNLTTLRDRDGFRRCTAAARRYNPVPDIGRRCENYLPARDDLDQRTGCERWPWLDQAKTN